MAQRGDEQSAYLKQQTQNEERRGQNAEDQMRDYRKRWSHYAFIFELRGGSFGDDDGLSIEPRETIAVPVLVKR